MARDKGTHTLQTVESGTHGMHEVSGPCAGWLDASWGGQVMRGVSCSCSPWVIRSAGTHRAARRGRMSAGRVPRQKHGGSGRGPQSARGLAQSAEDGPAMAFIPQHDPATHVAHAIHSRGGVSPVSRCRFGCLLVSSPVGMLEKTHAALPAPSSRYGHTVLDNTVGVASGGGESDARLEPSVAPPS